MASHAGTDVSRRGLQLIDALMRTGCVSILAVHILAGDPLLLTRAEHGPASDPAPQNLLRVRSIIVQSRSPRLPDPEETNVPICKIAAVIPSGRDANRRRTSQQRLLCRGVRSVRA